MPYRRLAAEVGIAPSLDLEYAEAMVLLAPVLDGSVTGHWDPAKNEWIS